MDAHLYAPAPWRVKIIPIFGDSFEPDGPAASQPPEAASCPASWIAEPAVSSSNLLEMSAHVPSMAATCRLAPAGVRFAMKPARSGAFRPIALARMAGTHAPRPSEVLPGPAETTMEQAATAFPFPVPVDGTHRAAVGAGWIPPATRPRAAAFGGVAGLLESMEEIAAPDRPATRRMPAAATHRPRLVPCQERHTGTPAVLGWTMATPAGAPLVPFVARDFGAPAAHGGVVPLNQRCAPLRIPGPLQGNRAAMLARPAWLGVTDRREPEIPHIASQLRGTAALPADAGPLPAPIPEPLLGDISEWPGDATWRAASATLPTLATNLPTGLALDAIPGTAGVLETAAAGALDGNRTAAPPEITWAAYSRRPAAALEGTFPAPPAAAVPMAPAPRCLSRPLDATAGAACTTERWMAQAPLATVLPAPVAAATVPAGLPAGAPAGIGPVAFPAPATARVTPAAPARIDTRAAVAVPGLAAVDGATTSFRGNLQTAGRVVRGESFPLLGTAALPAAAPAIPASAAAALLPRLALIPDVSEPLAAPHVMNLAAALCRTAPTASLENLADHRERERALPALELAPPRAAVPAAGACREAKAAPAADPRTGVPAADTRRAGDPAGAALPELPADFQGRREEREIRAPQAAGPVRAVLPVPAAPAPAKAAALPVTPSPAAAPGAGMPRLALEPSAPAIAGMAGSIALEYYVERTATPLAWESGPECHTAVTLPAFSLTPVLAAIDELAMQVWRRTRHSKGSVATMPLPGKLPPRRGFGMAQVKAIAAGIAVIAVLWLGGAPVRDSVASQRPWFWQAIADRATMEVTEDFHSGMQSWQSAGADWAASWSRHRDGYMQIGRLALFGPSLTRSDYRMEFLTEVERKSVGWVVRARDTENYYALKLTVADRGPRPAVSMVRYPVVGGKKGRRVEIPVPFNVDKGTPYRVAVDVEGTRFTASIEGQAVDTWTDDTLASGGVGFFNDAGEKARLYWMKLSSNDDLLGRICAFVAGKNTVEAAKAAHAMVHPAPEPTVTYALRAGAASPAIPGDHEIKENATCAYCREWNQSHSRRYPPGGCPGIPSVTSG